MKISFDAQLLMKGEKTGIGWCAENILQNLRHEGYNSYQLNCFSLGYRQEQLSNVEKYEVAGYKVKKCPWFHDVIYRIIWSFINIPYSIFFGNDSDVTVFFNYVIPPGVKGKKIAFVYDMAYKVYPETVRRKTKNLLKLVLQKSCKRADKIITISEFSKKEIVKYLNISEDKITVMPCGVDQSIYNPNYSQEEVQAIIQKLNIGSEYILYLGTLEPRKNIVRLINAYSQLKKENENIPRLVLAGRKGWMYKSIFETVINLKLEQDIVFTGYISEKDAPILINGAKIFVFPSLYEGFGMPPLEAMACGTPVVVSNIAPLAEVVGDAGVFVDPLSEESIREGLKVLINDEPRRKELSLKGIKRAKQFTWDKSVEVVKKVSEGL